MKNVLFPKNSSTFNQKKSSLVSVFTKTKNGLIKLIEEQRSYVADMVDERNKITHEIDVTEKSVLESEKLIEKIENFLN